MNGYGHKQMHACAESGVDKNINNKQQTTNNKNKHRHTNTNHKPTNKPQTTKHKKNTKKTQNPPQNTVIDTQQRFIHDADTDT